MSLLSITWPLFLTFTLNLMMPIVDSFFLSRVSDLAAGAVGALFSVLMVAYIATLHFTQAGVNIATQYLGGERHRRAGAAGSVTLLLSAAVGAVFSLIFFFLSKQIGVWLGLNDAANTFATAYLSVYGPFFVLKAVQSTLIQIIASRGHTFSNLVGVLVMNLVNIGLNYAFYEGLFELPRLGVRGVALATVVSIVVNIVFSLAVLKLYLKMSFVSGVTRALMREVARPVLRIGIPSTMEPTSYQVYQVTVTTLIVALGALALSTRVYVHNLVLIVAIGALSIGTGSQIIIAHLVGAGDFQQANRRLHSALGIGVILAVILIAGIWILAEPLLGLFTENPDIIALGKRIVPVEFIASLGRVFNVVVNNALRCTGDAKVPAVVGSFMMWTIGLGSCYLFGYVLGYGLVGIWMGLALDEAARAVFCYVRWRQGVWKTTGVNA